MALLGCRVRKVAYPAAAGSAFVFPPVTGNAKAARLPYCTAVESRPHTELQNGLPIAARAGCGIAKKKAHPGVKKAEWALL